MTWASSQRRINHAPTVTGTHGTDLSGSLEGAGGIGGLLARSHGYSAGNWSTHNYYHADRNGNITYLVNSSQTLAASYRYDPYGNTISSSGTLASANTYRFSSKEIQILTGLYYYGYRWYAPNLQRWLNRDPLGTGMVTLALHGLKSRPSPGELLVGPNLYNCLLNDPINHSDSDGRMIVPVLIIGGAVLAGWGLWELADAIKNAMKKAKIGDHNRQSQNEAISDTRTNYCPIRDRAVGTGLKELSPELYKMATGPGTLGGGPPGIPENAGDATISIIWTGVQPEPKEECIDYEHRKST